MDPVRALARRAAWPSRTPPRCATIPAVLLTDLDAFYLDHHQCGELDAGVEGPVIWFDCECGARMARRAIEEHGDHRLSA